MRRRLLLLTLALALAAPAGVTATTPRPLARASATCADFPNQAAAQRAHNTRDADGDGVYCESLPCPCAGPGQATPRQPTASGQPPATFNGRCKRGRLPDRSCSPGLAATTNVARICTPGYTQQVRNVSERTKSRVYAEYGIRRHSAGQYEVDHIVALELGGSNSIKNLFPEAARPRPGFHEKDRLENRLHALVCSGRLRIRTAQKALATNWVSAYRRYVLNG